MATPAITHRTAQKTTLSRTESLLGLIERIEAAGVERTLTSDSSVTLGWDSLVVAILLFWAVDVVGRSGGKNVQG